MIPQERTSADPQEHGCSRGPFVICDRGEIAGALQSLEGHTSSPGECNSAFLMKFSLALESLNRAE